VEVTESADFEHFEIHRGASRWAGPSEMVGGWVAVCIHDRRWARGISYANVAQRPMVVRQV